MHPQYGHSPPTRRSSTPTTSRPAAARLFATSSPPGPRPITTTSTSMHTSLFRGTLANGLLVQVSYVVVEVGAVGNALHLAAELIAADHPDDLAAPPRRVVVGEPGAAAGARRVPAAREPHLVGVLAGRGV